MHSRNRKTETFAMALFSILLFGMAQLSLAAGGSDITQDRLKKEVTRMLEPLPYYDVFDHLTFRIVAPSTVVLIGQVTRPGLKLDAEAAVRKIKSIRKVVNNIEVLPDSPIDDSIRWAAFEAIFDKPALQKYATQTDAPLRIIVKDREITLVGTVASQFDKDLIDISARSVRGALGVTDDLIVGS